MPLETANYITDLVPSNPAHSDGLNNADAHLRLIKGTIKATFPNFTDGALQSTQAELDAATTAVNTGGIAKLAASVEFAANTSDGLGNPVAGTVSVVSGGTVSASFTATAASVPGSFTAAGGQLGPGACPIGAVIIWPAPTLPTGFGVWAWCNGGTASRTANATLYGLIGTTYGVGDGSTTFNLPNYQETTLVGMSGMGGGTSPGLLSTISSALKGALAKIFGANTYTMQRSDLPNVQPTFTGTATEVVVESTSSEVVTGIVEQTTAGAAGAINVLEPGTTGYGILTSTGSFQPVGTVQSLNGNVTQTAMQTVQPSQAVGFIIRIA